MAVDFELKRRNPAGAKGQLYPKLTGFSDKNF